MLNLLAAACVIVVPTDTGFGNFAPPIVYNHEIAHCNGWVHGPDGNTMTNVFPPKEFIHTPSMKLIVKRGTTKETTKICKGMGADSYACQYFED